MTLSCFFILSYFKAVTGLILSLVLSLQWMWFCHGVAGLLLVCFMLSIFILSTLHHALLMSHHYAIFFICNYLLWPHTNPLVRPSKAFSIWAPQLFNTKWRPYTVCEENVFYSISSKSTHSSVKCLLWLIWRAVSATMLNK